MLNLVVVASCRQGNDSGPQYRSIVFYKDEAEHAAILAAIKRVREQQRLA